MMTIETLTEKQQKVLKRFKDRVDSGRPITYKKLKEEDSSLLYAVERNLKNISVACSLLGISQEEMIEKYGFTRNINKRTLSEDEILERLNYLKSIGKVTTNAMRNEFNDLRLEQSIKKVYGSVEACLEKLGFTRDYITFDEEYVVNYVKDLISKGFMPNYTNMQKYHPELINRGKALYGSWGKFLKHHKIECEKYKGNEPSLDMPEVDDAYCVNTIDSILAEKSVFTIQEVSLKDRRVIHYANKKYGGIKNLVSKIGYQDKLVDSVIDIKGKEAIKGKLLEELMMRVFNYKNIDYKYNKYTETYLRPDFQLKDDVWLDCKLSSPAYSIPKTIEKYLPHCNHLIIVVGSGDFSKYQETYPQVEFKYAHEYLDSVPKTEVEIHKLYQEI